MSENEELRFCPNDDNLLVSKIDATGHAVKECRTCKIVIPTNTAVLRDYAKNKDSEKNEEDRIFNYVIEKRTYPSILKKCIKCKGERMKFVRDPKTMRITVICINSACKTHWKITDADTEDFNQFHPTIASVHW